MLSWWCCLTVLPVLVGVAAAIEFVHSPRHCRDANMRCVHITNCPAFKTKEDVVKKRPMVCGFGREPMVCCGDTQQLRRRRITDTAYPGEPARPSSATVNVPSERPVRPSSATVNVPAERPVRPSSATVNVPAERPVRPSSATVNVPAERPIRPSSATVNVPAERPVRPSSATVTVPAERPVRPSLATITVPVERPVRPSPAITMPSERPLTSTSLEVTPSPLPERCGEPRSATPGTRFRRQADSAISFGAGDLQAPFPLLTTNILGGQDVGIVEKDVGGPAGHRWPWMVLLGRWTDDGLGDWFCGGTLITDRHVLTAAHCLGLELEGAIGVRIGDLDLTTPDEVRHQERNVSSIVRHPQFRGLLNDLAMLQLATPVELTFTVQPICLPPPGAEHDGQDVDAAGWGVLEFAGEPSDVLQEVPLRVTDPAACEAAYRRLSSFERRFPGGFQGTKVCAVSRDDQPRDACPGDSGGPLMVQLTDGTSQLVGVVSAGIGCGNPEFPGLYTKVSAYIDWIVSNLT